MGLQDWLEILPKDSDEQFVLSPSEVKRLRSDLQFAEKLKAVMLLAMKTATQVADDALAMAEKFKAELEGEPQ